MEQQQQFLTENEIRVTQLAQVSGDALIDGAAVDMANWEQATFWATIATADPGNYLYVQQDNAADFSSAETLAGTKVVAGANGDAVAVTVNRPTKRYLRAMLERGGENTATGEIYCARTGSRTVPVDNNVSEEIVSVAVASPDVDKSTYTLTYTAGDNGSITGTTPQYVDHGADGAEVTATAETNFEFAAWSDGVATAARTDTEVTGPIDVLATFHGEEVTVTFSASDATEPPDPDTKDVRHAGVYGALPVVERASFTFEGWRTEDAGEGDLVTAETVVAATANHTLYAAWEAE